MKRVELEQQGIEVRSRAPRTQSRRSPCARSFEQEKAGDRETTRRGRPERAAAGWRSHPRRGRGRRGAPPSGGGGDARRPARTRARCAHRRARLRHPRGRRAAGRPTRPPVKFRAAAALADRHYRLGAVPIATYVELQNSYPTRSKRCSTPNARPSRRASACNNSPASEFNAVQIVP